MKIDSRCVNYILALFVLLGLILLFVVDVHPVKAATIPVNTLDDEDLDNSNCSLREAIEAAIGDFAYNGCSAGSAGEDTITLAAGTYTLTSQIDSIWGSDIIITAKNPETTIIQASTCNPVTLPGGCTPADYRIFYLGTGTHLTLANLTIRHGVGTYGGAIYIGEGTLTLTNSILSGNLADGSSPKGGAIYAGVSSVLDVSDSTIIGNSSGQYGGGICNTEGDVTITDSIIQDNYSATYGGGIHSSGNLDMSGSTVSGNESNYGGGLGVSGSGDTIISNCTFTENHANIRGGAIENKESVIVTDSSFSRNTATNNGGGIYIYNGSYLEMERCTLTGNQAGADGGGIYSDQYVDLFITDSTLSNNSAVDQGGGICTYSNNTYTEVTGCTLTGNTAETGGGIYNGDTFSVIDSTFSSNIAENIDGPSDAGAILNAVSGSMDVENSTFFENSGRFGGAIQNLGDIEIINSTFSANIASVRGGGIYNFEILNLTNNTFYGNESAFGGAGIENADGGWLNYANTIIAYSITGADCNNEGVVASNESNLVEDNTCEPDYYGDPLLDTLFDNGGPTETHALLEGSPAIDAGDLTYCPGTDQRGVSRPKGAGCDIGAFELNYLMDLFLPLLMR